ncbi:hypothetical protein MalM14_00860 [Gimesia chilikensis]|nr:hypothetical protein MalM14_00860 [Gimesia chilikensis]
MPWNSHLLETLYLPFTADISDDQPVTSSSIRSYWSRVLSAILNQNKNDVALRFYEFLRANAGKLAVDKSHVRNRSNRQFIFLDTVVSGRAISEIFDAFNKYGLTDYCHYILIIDEQGKKLKPNFSHKIDEMESSGRATRILVDKIFTEDEGPAMSGIWTVTMPDLVLAAKEMIPDFSQTGDIAATFFYWEIQNREDESNKAISVSNALLFMLLNSGISDSDKSTKFYLEQFRHHINDTKLQRQVITQEIATPLIGENLNTINTDVSSSHVIRAFMDKQKAQKLVRSFLNK